MQGPICGLVLALALLQPATAEAPPRRLRSEPLATGLVALPAAPAGALHHAVRSAKVAPRHDASVALAVHGARKARQEPGEDAPAEGAAAEAEPAAKEEAPKEEAPVEEAAKEEAAKEEAPKEEAAKEEAAKEEAAKEEAPKEEAPVEEAAKEEAPKEEAPKEEAEPAAGEDEAPAKPKLEYTVDPHHPDEAHAHRLAVARRQRAIELHAHGHEHGHGHKHEGDGEEHEPKALPPLEQYLPTCVDHLRQLVHTLDREYTDLQLRQALVHECWLDKKFPDSVASGFTHHEACEDFAEMLTTARFEELEDEENTHGYADVCVKFHNHRMGLPYNHPPEGDHAVHEEVHADPEPRGFWHSHSGWFIAGVLVVTALAMLCFVGLGVLVIQRMRQSQPSNTLQ